MASILDQFGNPIKRQELEEEEATASMAGVRQIVSNIQTRGLTPEKLARIIRQADLGDATAYLELAEELEEKDTHYISVLGTRKRAVAQLEIEVLPASDDKKDIEAANIVEAWLDRDQLEAELFDILDAIGKGFSITEILWDTSSSPWLPKDLKWRDPRWFDIDQNNGETLYLKNMDNQRIPLKPHKYIIHTHKSKSGIAVRGGVVRPCVWMWLFKNFSIKDWVIFCEAYGQPVRVGKYGAGSSQKDKDILMRAVANIGSDAAAIIPESMNIEFIEAASKSGSIDAFERLCNFCDQQISKAVLGQTTTTDALGNGLAGNQAHNDVRGDIERSDAKQLAATINQQLIPLIISFNMGPQDRYPRIRIGRPEDVDIEKLSKAAQIAVGLGMKVSESKLRDKLGLPTPEKEDDTLAPARAAVDQTTPPATASAGTVKATASQNIPPQDGIDEIVDDLSGDWEEIMTPLVDQIEAALKYSSSFDDLKQKLLELTGTLRTKELEQKIERSSLNLRLAGLSGALITEE